MTAAPDGTPTTTDHRRRERTVKGVSPEARRAGRRRRLLNAALELTGAGGWSAATMRGVCAQAGLTQRYFYESFNDPQALVLALYDDVAAEAEHALLEALSAAEQDGPSRTHAAVDAFVRLVVSDPRKGRVLLMEPSENSELLHRRHQAFGRFVEIVAGHIEQQPGQPPVTPLEIAMSARALVGALTELLMARLRGEIQVPLDQLVGHATKIVITLTAPPPDLAPRVSPRVATRPAL
jgi:AcrR family transcriptional regulator